LNNFIEEDMEEKHKEMNKEQFLEVNITAVRDILTPLVHLTEFDPDEEDFRAPSEAICRPDHAGTLQV